MAAVPAFAPLTRRFPITLVFAFAWAGLSVGLTRAAAAPESLSSLATELRSHPGDYLTAARVGSALMHRDWLLPSRPPTNTVWLPSPSRLAALPTEIPSPNHRLTLRLTPDHLELVQASDASLIARTNSSRDWKSAGWHPGGVVVALAREGTLELRDAETLARLPLDSARFDGAAFAFSPDGLWLAASDPAGGVNLWDWAENRLLAQGQTARTGIRELSFSADGRWLRMRSADGEVTLDVRPSRTLGPWFVHTSPVIHAGLLADGRRTLTLHADGLLRMWSGGERETKGAMQLSSYPAMVVDSPDHAWAAIALPGGKARLWSATNSRPVGDWITHPGGIAGLAFDPTGHWLWIGGGTTLRTWDISVRPQRPGTISTGAPIVSLAGSPDSAWVAALRATDTGPVLQWWPSTDTNGVPIHEVKLGATNLIAFDPASHQILAATAPDRIGRWHLATGERVGPEIVTRGRVAMAGWSPDGERLVTAGFDGLVQVWQLKDAQPVGIAIPMGGPVRHAELDPTGNRVLVSAPDRSWRVFDVATGRPLTESWPLSGRIPVHRPIRAEGVRFTSDGSQVLVPDTELGVRWVPLPPLAAPPSWLSNFVSAVLGEGPGDPTVGLEAVRTELTREPMVKGAWEGWARWMLADRAQRPTSPGNALGMEALAGRSADLNETPGLLEAARLDPSFEWVQRNLMRQMRTNLFWPRPLHLQQSVWLENRAGRKAP